MSATDLLDIVVHLVFISLGTLAIGDYLRHRNETQRDVALMFGILAVPFLLQLIALIKEEEVSGAAQVLSVIALVLEPYLLLRLVRYLQSMPAYMMRLVGYSLIITIVTGILVGDRAPLFTTVISQGYLIGFNLYAMVGFARGVLRSTGVQRQRLRFAAAGSGLFALIFVATLVANAISLQEELAFLLLEVLAGACVVAYYVAFAPPRWLRQNWQLKELHDFLQQTTKRALHDSRAILNELSEAALRTVSGTTAIVATCDAEGKHLRIEIKGNPPLQIKTMENLPDAVGMAWREQKARVAVVPKDTGPELTRWGQGFGARALLIVPIISALRPWGLLIVALPYAPLFAQDDLDLLALFVQQSATALDYSLRIEKTIRVGKERYRTLFDPIDQGFCTIEVLFDENEKPVDYRFLIVNPAFERQTGISNAVGRRVREIAPLHEEYWFQIYGRIALTGEPLRFENPAEQFHRYYDVYAWRTGMPEERQVAILFNDITARKEAEKEIRRLNEELEERVTERTRQLNLAMQEMEAYGKEIQSIFDSMTTLNAKVAPDGRLLLVNNIAAEASGLPREALMKTNFLEGQWWAFDAEVQNRVRNAFAQACSGTSTNYDEKIFVFEQVLTINFSLTPMLGNDGRVEYILAEGRDITKLKEIEETLQSKTAQLEAANQELDAFSYSVSHDLRAPLRSIDGFSQALLEDYGSQLPIEGRGYLERVRKSAQYMAALIDDLLNLSRVTRAAMKMVPVDLSTLARGIAKELQNTQPERKAKFKIMPDLKGRGDSHLLRAVLENLLSNAWKYTSKREQAEIEFGSKWHSGETVYYVRDNGAGFDMAYAGKLFGAFQRLHAMSDFPGTGVGLATVQRIIHRHGGRIWAEAELDRGATFFFTLPIAERAKPKGVPPEQDSISRRAKQLI